MRKLILIALMAMMATSSLIGQDITPEALFDQQLEKSCEARLTVIKSVEDLNASSQQVETKSFTTSEGESCQLQDELTHAFLLYYGENKIKDYYQVTQTGDTLIATLLADKHDKAALLMQKIVLSADGKTLLYVETQIKRTYWLFSSYSYIQAVFDQKGLYQSHSLETETEVSLIGNGVNVRIRGEREEE